MRGLHVTSSYHAGAHSHSPNSVVQNVCWGSYSLSSKASAMAADVTSMQARIQPKPSRQRRLAWLIRTESDWGFHDLYAPSCFVTCLTWCIAQFIGIHTVEKKKTRCWGVAARRHKSDLLIANTEGRRTYSLRDPEHSYRHCSLSHVKYL